ncbi:MAG TPA: hypothetical protein VHD56_20215 [Tepidisphaeraceae bacterium]|nr:hypothetical protein [Tepidisphaeraceae bacterium]
MNHKISFKTRDSLATPRLQIAALALARPRKTEIAPSRKRRNSNWESFVFFFALVAFSRVFLQ